MANFIIKNKRVADILIKEGFVPCTVSDHKNGIRYMFEDTFECREAFSEAVKYLSSCADTLTREDKKLLIELIENQKCALRLLDIHSLEKLDILTEKLGGW